MITARTRRQLIAFLLISLVGISYVGARYARLDRLVYDSSFEVHAQFIESGGIFTGSEVAYRGVTVGQVSDMRLTADGVDVVLTIDNGHQVPSDTLAVVANRSAVGEQYVDLEPRTDAGPYLHDGSVIKSSSTRVPVSTTELLTNADRLITSLPQASLRSAISELGSAFNGTGPDLARIIDTSNKFVAAANNNFDVTTALIRDSNIVLRAQADKGSAIRDFSRDLALFSGTLAGHDKQIRQLINSGQATASELRTFLEANQVDLGSLLNNLRTTTEVFVKHLPGQRQILVLYPYLVASGFTIVEKVDGGYNTRSGLLLTQTPGVCHKGYDPSQVRAPTDVTDKPMVTTPGYGCTEPASKTNARGSQNAPRPAAFEARASDVAYYDRSSGQLAWLDQDVPLAFPPEAQPLSSEDALRALLHIP